MNWDELFEDRLADAGHLVGAIDEAGDHVTLVEAPVGEVIRIVREALLSDETIERAAQHVNELSGVGSMACAGCGIPGGYAEGCEDCRRVCEGIARRILTAAIEGEQ